MRQLYLSGKSRREQINRSSAFFKCSHPLWMAALFYPNATSKIIITKNPPMKASTERSV